MADECKTPARCETGYLCAVCRRAAGGGWFGLFADHIETCELCWSEKTRCPVGIILAAADAHPR